MGTPARVTGGRVRRRTGVRTVYDGGGRKRVTSCGGRKSWAVRVRASTARCWLWLGGWRAAAPPTAAPRNEQGHGGGRGGRIRSAAALTAHFGPCGARAWGGRAPHRVIRRAPRTGGAPPCSNAATGRAVHVLAFPVPPHRRVGYATHTDSIVSVRSATRALPPHGPLGAPDGPWIWPLDRSVFIASSQTETETETETETRGPGPPQAEHRGFNAGRRLDGRLLFLLLPYWGNGGDDGRLRRRQRRHRRAAVVRGERRVNQVRQGGTARPA
ncbi:hypothetical protein BS78_06G209800, partial [Paspalum vaginatum]